MFNPKSNTLLDQQMSVSGLEMALDPMTIMAGVSAVSSIVGGISGSQQASQNNKDAKKAYKEQKKANKEQAKITTKYNKEVFEADKKDYYAQREFQWETAQREWQYNNSILDYRFLQDVRMYGKSVDTYKSTLAFNSLAAQQAYESVQAQLAELEDQQAFGKQNMLVERLQAEGQAQVGQAGRSMMKTQQATLADQGMNLAVMREELRSADEQANVNMRDISIQKYAADENAKANLMLRPERPPRPLEPVQGPERTFVKPPKVKPGFTPPPLQQNTMAPLISGFGNAMSSLSSINWNPAKPSNPIG